MCIQPTSIYHPEYGTIPVSCRTCWQCRNNRVQDYVGRCVAESMTATASSVLTLTYAGDSVGSVVLLSTHIQGLMKRLRRRGYPVRYIVAGEFGSLHGRAHWHAVLFWQGPVPDLPAPDTFGDWPHFWPHGHVHVGRFDYAWLRYTLKYLLKDYDSDVTAHRLLLSKKPPLGRDWFYQFADALVERRVMPRSWLYSFPQIVDHSGRPVQFYLSGAQRFQFGRRLETSWRLVHGVPPPETEFWTENWLDPAYKEDDCGYTYFEALERKAASDRAAQKTGVDWTSFDILADYNARNSARAAADAVGDFVLCGVAGYKSWSGGSQRVQIYRPGDSPPF